ncbi:MAG: outer membrane protein assembly factor BamD [Deltaproteobacteria bacterium]|nr:outer membrane protein assembly factor BamD [Deltaproteobacteria bacterium]
MKRLNIGSFLIVFVFLSLSLVQAQEKPAGSEEVYDSAMELFHKGRYQEAIEGFSKLIRSFPASRLVPYSHYMMGQIFLKMETYEEAIQKFEYYLKTFPGGDRAKESEQGLSVAREKVRPKKEISGTAVEAKPAPVEPKRAETPRVIEEPKKEEARKVIEEPKKVEVVKVAEETKKEEVKVPIKEEVKAPSEKPVTGVVSEAKKVKRRVCAQVSYLEGKNLVEVEKRIKELKDAGVDTLIFRVFQNKGDRMYKFVKARHEEGVFFKTEHAPIIDDILGKIAEIVHRHGLELFAWMTTRYATYGVEKHTGYRSRIYNFETKKMEIGRGFNLYHPDVLKRLEGLFRDLGRYPIDGILFQDDLILRHNEDFSVEANKAFLKDFGYSPHPDTFYIDPYKSEFGKYYVKGYTDQFWTWAKWKNRYLMDVAKRLVAAARESNPKLQFAVNLYFEAVLNDTNGVAWFSQTLEEALNKGFDYYAVMAYHRQAMKGRGIELKESIDLMAEVSQKAVRSVGDSSRVMMKIWILDWKSNQVVGYELAPQKEIEEILGKILEQGEVSLAFVPYTHQFPLHQLKGKWSVSK